MKYLLILLFSVSAFAHDPRLVEPKNSVVKIQYGLAFNDDNVVDDISRSINIGYYTQLESALSWNVHAGWLGDKDIGLSTGYACAQFGASLRPFIWAFIENYFGPCYFDHTGDKLSGHLQFATNIGAGWRDPKTGSEIGLHLKHFSNAGLSKPNIGRDLLMLSLAFGL